MGHPFRGAVEAADLDAVLAMCRQDVVFRSPVVFTPYEGRDALRPILAAVMEVFEDFRYVRELDGEHDHALVFQARVGDKELEGCDFLHLDEDGLISELTVMVRPMSALMAVAEAMRARLTAG
ncbi:nuclear transport factor 2 family protein [Mycolicibacterium sp. XJ1819]